MDRKFFFDAGRDDLLKQKSYIEALGLRKYVEKRLLPEVMGYNTQKGKEYVNRWVALYLMKKFEEKHDLLMPFVSLPIISYQLFPEYIFGEAEAKMLKHITLSKYSDKLCPICGAPIDEDSELLPAFHFDLVDKGLELNSIKDDEVVEYYYDIRMDNLALVCSNCMYTIFTEMGDDRIAQGKLTEEKMKDHFLRMNPGVKITDDDYSGYRQLASILSYLGHQTIPFIDFGRYEKFVNYKMFDFIRSSYYTDLEEVVGKDLSDVSSSTNTAELQEAEKDFEFMINGLIDTLDKDENGKYVFTEEEEHLLRNGIGDLFEKHTDKFIEVFRNKTAEQDENISEE
ncbi:MAG: hypothetical protein HPY53_01110 [Brevinematales bacterium]|nr:hypothetical protein [Brevinematales bacterium]